MALIEATARLSEPFVDDSVMRGRVEFICRCIQNRAGARLLLAALIAKISNPGIDIRKPYTEIGGVDTYSGRRYDETYITPFINENNLPLNSTTAFLTPAFRNRNITLTPDLNMVGRPAKLYQNLLQLLTDVHENKIQPTVLLLETIRFLLLVRNEKQQRMEMLLAGLRLSPDAPALSAEGIVTLIDQHLKSPHASRLPVLVVAAAYQAASIHLNEQLLPLERHNAADEQTGALGDLEITLLDDDQVITSYEMKLKRVTITDIDRALQKIQNSDKHIDNYIFITTDVIEDAIVRYAASIYEKTGGIEVVVLDCLSFLRYFLHLFHRLRMEFLDAYQQFVLTEPDSAVSQPLKEAFLALRQVAESGE
jgi:DNA adenine methylase